MALLLCLSFAAEHVASAAPEMPAVSKALFPFTLPSSVGTVAHRFEGRSPYTVYLIEEAHANPGAERNIASILEAVIRKHSDFGGVFVEAGTGELSLTSLRPLASADRRRRVADRYLSSGRMHGAEYLQLATDLNFAIHGAENPALYRRALASYRRTAAHRERLLNYLSSIRVSLAAIGRTFSDPALGEFVDRRGEFQNGSASASDYLKVLDAARARLDISLESFPALEKWNKVRALEAAVDFSAAQTEAASIVQHLPEGQFHPKKLKDLREQVRLFEGLERAASQNGKTPEALRAYIAYMRAASAVDPAGPPGQHGRLLMPAGDS